MHSGAQDMNTCVTYFSPETPVLYILPKSRHPPTKTKCGIKKKPKTTLDRSNKDHMADLSRFFPGLGLGAAAPNAAPPLAQPAEQVQKRKSFNS